jgi:hypothetical protein
VAEKVRTSADRIRERVKKTVEDIIEVGNPRAAPGGPDRRRLRVSCSKEGRN